MSIGAKIARYFSITQEESKLKKEKDPIGKEIKEHLRNTEGQHLEIDGFEASISDRGTVMDQEKMLKILKKLKRKDLIKKVEIPDMDKIETLIYNQELDGKLFAECVSPKQKDVISVKKSKEKKGAEEDGESQSV